MRALLLLLVLHAQAEGLFWRCLGAFRVFKGGTPAPSTTAESAEDAFFRIRQELGLSDAQTPNNQFFEVHTESPNVKRPLAYPGTTNIKALGSGGMGTVYRADLEGKTMVIKIFYEGPDTAATEIRSLRILRREANNRGFYFPTAKTGDVPGSEILENIEGQNLSKILTDPDVPPQLKARLVEDYHRNVQQLDTVLRRKFLQLTPPLTLDYFKVKGFDGQLKLNVYKLKSATGLEFDFTTKPDNIIVDPQTLRMTIVDTK